MKNEQKHSDIAFDFDYDVSPLAQQTLPRLATRRPLKGLPVATLQLCAHYAHYSVLPCLTGDLFCEAHHRRV